MKKRAHTTPGIPIKMWLTDIDDKALQQAKNLAMLPFAYKHIALMPDCHAGFGMPIGAVLATRGVVIPNAVGVDIGCGIGVIKTDLHHINMRLLTKLTEQIYKTIPMGFNHHKEMQDVMLMPPLADMPDNTVVMTQYDTARKQLGTLGGGNHFIEIQKGSDGYVWIMVHSGSRNIGYKVADHYNRLAKGLRDRWEVKVEKKYDLAYLPAETPEAKAYMAEMNYCIAFALANRKLMINNILSLVRDTVKQPVTILESIDIAHNYARWETHYDEQVLVHRKGAISAQKGEIGIIPGSQGTKSYIVQGKGNKESFLSCSHGAGRMMGRKQAQRQLILNDEIEKLEQKGIIHAIHSTKDLDEAPGAYKDINSVMKLQKDLVDIVVELTPLAVVKG